MADGFDAGHVKGFVHNLTQFVDVGAQGAPAGSGVAPEGVLQLLARHNAGGSLEQFAENAEARGAETQFPPLPRGPMSGDVRFDIGKAQRATV